MSLPKADIQVAGFKRYLRDRPFIPQKPGVVKGIVDWIKAGYITFDSDTGRMEFNPPTEEEFRKQKTLEKLEQDHTWPFYNMICLKNWHDDGTCDYATLKYQEGNYILIPNVHPNHPFSVPKNARRGGKEFLEVLINEGWRLD